MVGHIVLLLLIGYRFSASVKPLYGIFTQAENHTKRSDDDNDHFSSSLSIK